jgi:hypothetical protein
MGFVHDLLEQQTGCNGPASPLSSRRRRDLCTAIKRLLQEPTKAKRFPSAHTDGSFLAMTIQKHCFLYHVNLYHVNYRCDCYRPASCLSSRRRRDLCTTLQRQWQLANTCCQHLSCTIQKQLFSLCRLQKHRHRNQENFTFAPSPAVLKVKTLQTLTCHPDAGGICA